MSKEKNERMVSALNHAAALVGERQSLNGMETGLGLTLQRDLCLEEVRTITDGLFRVVVMGTFTSGKSTLVNALLGSRILPESALPSTAILTFIQYGCDEDDVEIHYKDTVNADGSVTAGCVEHVSKQEFVDTYQYTNADYGKVFRTILDTYNDSVEKVREDRTIYERNGQFSAEKQDECLRIIGEIETGLNATETSFDNCNLKLQNTLVMLIHNAVDSVDKRHYKQYK